MKQYLWSLRWSVAKGNHWNLEREVTDETCQEWLKVFRNDEPKILFLVSSRKPSTKKGK